MDFLKQGLNKLRSKIPFKLQELDEIDIQWAMTEFGIGYLIFAVFLHPLFFSQSILARLFVYIPSLIFFSGLTFLYLPKRDQMNIHLDRERNQLNCFVGGVDRKALNHPLDKLSQVKVEERKEYKTVERNLAYGATTQGKAWVNEYRLVFCFKNRCDIPWIPWNISALPLTKTRLHAIERKINRFISQSTTRKHLTIIGDPIHGLFGIFGFIATFFGSLTVINLVQLAS